MQINNPKSLRDFSSKTHRKNFLEQELNLELPNIENAAFLEEEVVGRNIENLIGATHVPLGVAGPLKVTSNKVQAKSYYVPLATTEGALVASVSRGCKAIGLGGGVQVELENVGISRGPVFRTSGISQALLLKEWLKKHFEILAEKANETSSHIRLLNIDSAISGRRVFVRFSFDTTDAMGMNMATIATEHIAKFIEKKTKVKCLSVAGNFDIDKKPAWLNFLSGRGRKVWAEVTLNKQVLEEVLKVTPEEVYHLVVDKNAYGSIMSGSIGFNAHFANIIAAIFIATGQDVAHVVEGSLGVTSAELLPNGDLYFSIYLPALVIGTVGGGTHLPTQQEALRILGVGGSGKVGEFAKIIGGAVLAGELSLIASQAQGTLSKAHMELGRKKSKL